jgi:D-sedoheptulose 7-phosphate isomerase
MKKIISEIIAVHKKLVERLEKTAAETIAEAAKIITASLKKNGCVYLCGNGGSAADCQHIAGEFIGRFRRKRKALPAVALSTDTSVISCIANDYGFEDVFTRQVEALVRKGDVLWAFSTSGSSPNVLAAAKLARKKGARVIAFTGRSKSELEKTADCCFCADTEYTSSAQEMHQLAYHIICDLVEQSFCFNKPKK